MPTKALSIEEPKVHPEATETELPNPQPSTPEGRQPGLTLPGELNRRIQDIDASVEGVKAALKKINAEVKQSLSRLTENDEELTSRVGQTYQQLGELDKAYRALSKQSTGIQQQLAALTQTFEEHADQSSTRFQEFAEGHAQLLERTEELQQKSKNLSMQLTRSINSNLKAMSELEGQLQAEIGALAQRTQERDDALAETSSEIDRRLTGTEENVRAYEVRLLKMQAVDRALEQRADALERTATELKEQGKGLVQSTRSLHERLGVVAAEVVALQAQAKAQGERIEGLDERTGKLDSTLLAAMGLERKHFRQLGVSVALLLLLLAAFMVSQHLGWQEQEQTNAAMQGDLQQLQGRTAKAAADFGQLEAQLQELDERVSGLSDQVGAQEQQTSQALSGVAAQLNTQTDRLDSLQGQIANHRPQATFGKDGVIHGPQWLLGQPADHYLIQLATVSEKQELYRLAERYGHYLQDELAYVPVQQGYALVYGSFADWTEATNAQAGLPPMIEGQRPRIYPMGSVQGYLGQ